jgi:nucleoside-diphosphate-sugar epimerase
MRVFVTGATGCVGGAVVSRLLETRHEVAALTRDAHRAGDLERRGVRAVLGDLAEPESYLATLKNCDAVVHAALDADPDAARHDQLALEAIREGAQDGRVRRLVSVGSIAMVGDTGGRVVDESAPAAPPARWRWRPAHEEAALDLGLWDLESIVLRAGLVYGGPGGVLAAWLREARERGRVSWPGSGSQHWCLVHRDDLAEAFRLALERPLVPASRQGQDRRSTRYLVADPSSHTARELAEAVARAAGARAMPGGGPVPEELMFDQRVTSLKARRELGWAPRHPSVMAEIERLHRDASGDHARVA